MPLLVHFSAVLYVRSFLCPTPLLSVTPGPFCMPRWRSFLMSCRRPCCSSAATRLPSPAPHPILSRCTRETATAFAGIADIVDECPPLAKLFEGGLLERRFQDVFQVRPKAGWRGRRTDLKPICLLPWRLARYLLASGSRGWTPLTRVVLTLPGNSISMLLFCFGDEPNQCKGQRVRDPLQLPSPLRWSV